MNLKLLIIALILLLGTCNKYNNKKSEVFPNETFEKLNADSSRTALNNHAQSNILRDDYYLINL
jgi:hypothetical protein